MLCAEQKGACSLWVTPPPSKGSSAGTARLQVICPQFPMVLPCFSLSCSSPCWEVLGGREHLKIKAKALA